MKKVLTQHTNTVTNMLTGEVVYQEETKVCRLPQEPPFVKMYIQDLCAVKGVSDSDQALLRHLLLRLDYEGYINLNARTRESLYTLLRIKNKRLRNRLNTLVKSNLPTYLQK